jgi:hypothetical protein
MTRPILKDLMFPKWDPDADEIVLDKELAVKHFSPVCTFCVHATDPFGTCAAFPDGRTPLVIWNGENPHTEPYKDEDGDDGGVQFEDIRETESEEE